MLSKDAWDEALLGNQPNLREETPRALLPGPAISKSLIPLTGLLLALVVYSGVELSNKISLPASFPEVPLENLAASGAVAKDSFLQLTNSLSSTAVDSLASSADLLTKGYGQLGAVGSSLTNKTIDGIEQEFTLINNLAAAAAVVPKNVGFMAASGVASVGDVYGSAVAQLNWWVSSARDFLVAYGQEIGNRWRSFVGRGDTTLPATSAMPVPVTLDDETKSDIKDIKSGVSEILRRLNQPSASVNTAPNQGMVVVPQAGGSTASDLKAKVGSMFSDQVNVSFDETGQAGIITPVFRQGQGDDYLFVLTPIAQ